MRDLQHLCAQVAARRTHRRFTRPIEVARQEQRVAPGVHPQHQRSGIARSGRPLRRRPQRFHIETAQVLATAAAPALDPHAARAGATQQRREGRIVARGLRQPQRLDLERVEHRQRAARVVGIGVREHERIETSHTELHQRRHHARAPEVSATGRGPRGVDEHARAARLQERRIARTHVEEDGAR